MKTLKPYYYQIRSQEYDEMKTNYTIHGVKQKATSVLHANGASWQCASKIKYTQKIDVGKNKGW